MDLSFLYCVSKLTAKVKFEDDKYYELEMLFKNVSHTAFFLYWPRKFESRHSASDLTIEEGTLEGEQEVMTTRP
jgi:hypothetical protein